jgi:ABC-2 type transport system ATP-binding protein
LLELLWLQSSRHSPISSYSKGMKQRVLLAAALLHNPRLLIFDEPLSGLDVVSARLFKELLQELAREGKAILYISHVLEVVEQVCDRVIVLSKGKILADAPPSELTALMELSSLENVFAQLVRQQDTRSIARDVVDAIRGSHD